MFGFHIMDIIAITIYFISIVFIGFLAKKPIKGEEDYFLGGRKFGKLVYQDYESDVLRSVKQM